jgi:hypothetical protein
MRLSITTKVYYAEFHYAECRNLFFCYAELRNAECHYAECRYAECRGVINALPTFYMSFIFPSPVQR